MPRINANVIMKEYAEELEEAFGTTTLSQVMSDPIGTIATVKSATQPSCELEAECGIFRDTFMKEQLFSYVGADDKVSMDDEEPKESGMRKSAGQQQKGRGIRRRQTAMNKRKMRRTADMMERSMLKRDTEDGHIAGYCKKRGGHKVTSHKSLGITAGEYIKRAGKVKAR